ncbi:uncharacterized protein LOC122348107 [Puntigrus tetrazona]|uniref:uncharacterized protein LOC122348107 n=1 Tax=Puntigrus tetrazona TaxID=1606681 RepID=UPI001C89848E|nr:uncharacterized protein LOC122348107 [Puntigrus tetrazona]XP_043099307.1 uncharacterized protein LOC122348107 [Puntigrus tetrazona]
MFGQEPRLPVDFLLGRGQERQSRGINEWVLEHQTRLQVAFEGAREHLKAAADRRKEKYDSGVRDAPLGEGHLVYLRNYGRRGRHKIQDLWSPVVYRVIRAPKTGGSVYTIAPVDDLSKVKHVHRSLLKNRVQRDPAVFVPTEASAVVEAPPVEESSSVDEVDLWVVVPEPPQLGGGPVMQNPASLDPAVSLRPAAQQDAVEGGTLDALGASGQSGLRPRTSSLGEPLLVEQPTASEVSVRRTGRANAGLHSNRYHLPRAVGGMVESGASVLNSVSALFRPWN